MPGVGGGSQRAAGACVPGLCLGKPLSTHKPLFQMKMPSKKFAHIPVYTLGFESPQRVANAKATATQRRDVFQCVPLLFADTVWSGTAGNAGAGVGVCPVGWDTPRKQDTDIWEGSGAEWHEMETMLGDEVPGCTLFGMFIPKILHA